MKMRRRRRNGGGVMGHLKHSGLDIADIRPVDLYRIVALPNSTEVATGMDEEAFAGLVRELVWRSRRLIQRTRHLNTPEGQMEVAAERLLGFEDFVWGIATVDRPLALSERELRNLVVSTRRYLNHSLTQLNEPVVLTIPIERATLRVPYTTSVRGRFGGTPTPDEVSTDIYRFLRNYEGWVGNILLSALTRVPHEIGTEVRRVVRVYRTRRESYLEWLGLCVESLELYRSRVEVGVERDTSSSEDDTDSEPDSGADVGEGGDGSGDACGKGGGNGGGAAPAQAVVVA